MRRKWLLLLLAVGLFGLGLHGTVLGANLVINPNYELDDTGALNLTNRVIEPEASTNVLGWFGWHGSERVEQISDHPVALMQGIAGSGSIWTPTSTATLDGGTVYYLEVDARSVDGLPATGNMVIENGDQSENPVLLNLINVPDGTWAKYTFVLDTNTGENAEDMTGQTFMIALRSVSGEIAVTNWWLDTEVRPSQVVINPNPSNNQESVPISVTSLSWERLDDCVDANSLVELWWGDTGADDLNFWSTSTKIMDLADIDSFDLGDANGGAISLVLNEEYFWGLKYGDPDGCGFASLIEGPVWSFDTINREPVVDAGLHYDRWQDAIASPITISLNGSFTDDGIPVGGTVTHSWGAVSGVTYDPGGSTSTVLDPDITVSTPGDYSLTLTVNDGSVDGSDTTLVRIFANDDDRLRAHYLLDELDDGFASDIAGGHTGILVGDPVWQPDGGQVGGAIELDGLGDYIEIDSTGSDPNHESDTWENSDLVDGMTISVWMKLTGDRWSKEWQSVVSKSNGSWELIRGGLSNNVVFAAQGGVGSATSSGVDVTSGWHQIVGVFDRNDVLIYVDGLPAGSNPANAPQIIKTAGKIRIGNTNIIGGSAELEFKGLLDQVRIFDAAIPWRAEHPGTPGIVEMFQADGGRGSCRDQYEPADRNKDCYVDIGDFALTALSYMTCNDIADELCD